MGKLEQFELKKSDGGLGFRNIHEFNIALLGKQGWRVIKHPNKLVRKVFKARYYPGYIWRCVIESQALLKQGLGCRVGSGSTINILNDPWLRT